MDIHREEEEIAEEEVIIEEEAIVEEEEVITEVITAEMDEEVEIMTIEEAETGAVVQITLILVVIMDQEMIDFLRLKKNSNKNVKFLKDPIN